MSAFKWHPLYAPSLLFHNIVESDCDTLFHWQLAGRYCFPSLIILVLASSILRFKTVIKLKARIPTILNFAVFDCSVFVSLHWFRRKYGYATFYPAKFSTISPYASRWKIFPSTIKPAELTVPVILPALFYNLLINMSNRRFVRVDTEPDTT